MLGLNDSAPAAPKDDLIREGSDASFMRTWSKPPRPSR